MGPLACVGLVIVLFAAAVDGKTACQGHDAQGNPVHVLTVFVHRLKVVLGQWSVKGEKTNEPGVLKNHLDELLREFPLLNLLTGDALFAQRPLVEAIRQGVVKTPVLPYAPSRAKLNERQSSKFTERYEDYLHLGVVIAVVTGMEEREPAKEL